MRRSFLKQRNFVEDHFDLIFFSSWHISTWILLFFSNIDLAWYNMQVFSCNHIKCCGLLVKETKWFLKIASKTQEHSFQNCSAFNLAQKWFSNFLLLLWRWTIFFSTATDLKLSSISISIINNLFDYAFTVVNT